ncbi:hypothetical protein Patl1_24547 [Pistacia atlantica]|uniref:Uncharacterized protein n=1 Tax=Pistacia atlantica TaxID=434234 RepID=A0ACC0ZWE2_9ROSI|nr:hypothetical protein Patl1_24547 [Pistacia atlantica]
MDRSQRIKFQTTNLSQLHNCEPTPKKWYSLLEQTRISLTELGRGLKFSLRHKQSSSQRDKGKDDDEALVSDVEIVQQWAAIERLLTFDRLKASLFNKEGEGTVVDGEGKRLVDVTKLGLVERRAFIEKLIKHIEHDNLKLLGKIRERIELVGVELPIIEVRYKNSSVEADCEIVHGKPLPTLWNSLKLWLWVSSKSNQAKLTIINDINSIIKPGSVCSNLMLPLSYNGCIDLSNSIWCLFTSEDLLPVNLFVLGLDICADTIMGDEMRRGISGSQKRRLAIGEMVVGPIKALFMDEITNGLDSSTTYQIVACLQQLVHITDATILISLLQPPPETFELFDDIIIMAEGKVISRKDQAQCTGTALKILTIMFQ